MGTKTVSGQPLVQTGTANECLAVRTLREVIEYVGTDSANELLQYFFEFRLRVVDAELLELVGAYRRTQLLVDHSDQLRCPLKGVRGAI